MYALSAFPPIPERVDRPVRELVQPLGVLPALPAVGLAAHGVHGQGQGGVGLKGDGAVGHGPRHKALDDLGGRLYLLEGDGLGGGDGSS